MLKRRDLLLVEGGADRDRKVAGGVQRAAATLVVGVAKSNFTAYGCDVNSLIGTGAKTRASQKLGVGWALYEDEFDALSPSHLHGYDGTSGPDLLLRSHFGEREKCESSYSNELSATTPTP